jgi:hypothetical protein
MEMNEVIATLETISARLIDEQELAALHAATDALKTGVPAKSPRATSAGLRWTDEEDAQLGIAFDAGRTIASIAASHGRTKSAITLRLVKLGRIDPATVQPRSRG